MRFSFLILRFNWFKYVTSWHRTRFVINYRIDDCGNTDKTIRSGKWAKWAGFSSNEAYLVGAGMVSRGEMALIIAQIGKSKLISDDYYSAIITAIILTTLLAPLLLKHRSSYKLPKHLSGMTPLLCEK